MKLSDTSSVDNADEREQLYPTMCIVHKDFRGFRAVSPASNSVGSLIGLKPAIPYDTIHSTLAPIPLPWREFTNLSKQI